MCPFLYSSLTYSLLLLSRVPTYVQAKAGRASYVAEDQLVNPDPGAHAVGIIMRAIYEAAKKNCQAAGVKME